MIENKKKPAKEKVEAFWEWFVDHREIIKEVLEDELHIDREATIEALNNEVLEFGLFSWHVGEGNVRPNYFTISPNGSKELLILSKYIVSLAPNIPGWEFHYARQVIDWDGRIQLYDSFMQLLDIDTRAWRATLDEMPDDYVSITLYADNMDHIDFDTRLSAANFAVMKLIGEEEKILNVGEVNFASIDQIEGETFKIQDLEDFYYEYYEE